MSEKLSLKTFEERARFINKIYAQLQSNWGWFIGDEKSATNFRHYDAGFSKAMEITGNSIMDVYNEFELWARTEYEITLSISLVDHLLQNSDESDAFDDYFSAWNKWFGSGCWMNTTRPQAGC